MGRPDGSNYRRERGRGGGCQGLGGAAEGSEEGEPSPAQLREAGDGEAGPAGPDVGFRAAQSPGLRIRGAVFSSPTPGGLEQTLSHL